MATTESARARYRNALAVPEFLALFAASSVSVLGSVVATVALTVLVYERTNSPFLSSLAFALGFLPYVVSGLLLSAVVDRVPPRLLLTTSDLTCALLAALMAWPRAPIPVLLTLLLLISTVTSISSGARGGLVREVVGDVAFIPARSLMRISAQSAQIAGNGLGGLLLVVLSPQSLIVLNAVSFAVSALVTRLGLHHRPRDTAAGSGPLLLDSLRGAAAIFGNRTVRRLLLFGWLLPLFSVAPESLAAPYVLGSGGSHALVGVWLAALPTGVIAGDLLGIWQLTVHQQRRLIAPIAALGVLPYLAFFARPPIPVALALLVVAGLGAGYFLGLDGLIRDTTPRALFSRVMAINTAGLMTTQGLGFAAAGALAQVLHPATVIATAGACGLLTILTLRPDESAKAYASTPSPRQ